MANGQHNIAAYEYPLVGMQSQYDPDNIEYQVLSAKTAGIDGFFVEWGYIDHIIEHSFAKNSGGCEKV